MSTGNQPIDRHQLSEQLCGLRDELGMYHILASDAILKLIELLGENLPQSKRVWLNRELVGYHESEITGNTNRVVVTTPMYGSVNHRKMNGVWGFVTDAGKAVDSHDDALTHNAVGICIMGVGEIELELAKYLNFDNLQLGGSGAESVVNDAVDSLTLLSLGNARGSDFLVFVGEFMRLYLQIRQEICWLIDEAALELGLVPVRLLEQKLNKGMKLTLAMDIFLKQRKDRLSAEDQTWLLSELNGYGTTAGEPRQPENLPFYRQEVVEIKVEGPNGQFDLSLLNMFDLQSMSLTHLEDMYEANNLNDTTVNRTVGDVHVVVRFSLEKLKQVLNCVRIRLTKLLRQQSLVV